MFINFCTPCRFHGIFEVAEVLPMETFKDNKNIKIKVRAVRRRIDKSRNKIYDYDSFYVKFWASSAEKIEQEVSVGDIIEIQGELRGSHPNVDFRSISFEILTPSEEELENINA